jgi:hypothetical protein
VAAFVDDPHRFRDAKAVGRYFGLVTSQDQSGDRNRLGHITREGPAVVRQLVAESTWQAIRRSPTVRAYFERVRRGDPQRKKIALVATAHYLVRVMWALLKHGTVWEEDPGAADGPNRHARTVAKTAICSNTHASRRSSSDARCLRRASSPERGGDPLWRMTPNGCLGSPAIVSLRS